MDSTVSPAEVASPWQSVTGLFMPRTAAVFIRNLPPSLSLVANLTLRFPTSGPPGRMLWSSSRTFVWSMVSNNVIFSSPVRTLTIISSSLMVCKSINCDAA